MTLGTGSIDTSWISTTLVKHTECGISLRVAHITDEPPTWSWQAYDSMTGELFETGTRSSRRLAIDAADEALQRHLQKKGSASP